MRASLWLQVFTPSAGAQDVEEATVGTHTYGNAFVDLDISAKPARRLLCRFNRSKTFRGLPRLASRPQEDQLCRDRAGPKHRRPFPLGIAVGVGVRVESPNGLDHTQCDK